MHIDTVEPEALVVAYYEALYSGDLKKVSALSTHASYVMTLESFGLRLSLRDASFKEALKEMEDNPYALIEVEHKLSTELKKRDKHPYIKILNVTMNGDSRQTVDFEEDGKAKKLFFSREDESWKLDYFAGRKVA